MNSTSVPYKEWLHHRGGVLKRVDDDLQFPKYLHHFKEFNNLNDAACYFERVKNEYCCTYYLSHISPYIHFEGAVLKQYNYDDYGDIKDCLILDFYRDDYKED